jgi:hypothetical protein
MREEIRVLKRNINGEVTWQYEGHVLRRQQDAVVLEAFFNRPDLPFLDIVFREKDRFVETFYSDRWYNIFEIYDREDGRLKGWYCNIGRPAVIEKGTISYIDLALDLWVSPEGTQTVLDKSEFNALNLEPTEREEALNALAELQKAFKKRKPPF